MSNVTVKEKERRKERRHRPRKNEKGGCPHLHYLNPFGSVPTGRVGDLTRREILTFSTTSQRKHKPLNPFISGL